MDSKLSGKFSSGSTPTEKDTVNARTRAFANESAIAAYGTPELHGDAAARPRTPRTGSARFGQPTLKYKVRRVWNAVRMSLVGPSAPSDSASNAGATDLERRMSHVDYGAGQAFRLKSGAAAGSTQGDLEEQDETRMQVTVVDRDFTEVLQGGPLGRPPSEHSGHTPDLGGGGTRAPEMTEGHSGSTTFVGNPGLGLGSQNGSSYGVAGPQSRIQSVKNFFRYDIYPACTWFFDASFSDPAKEKNFQKEQWFFKFVEAYSIQRSETLMLAETAKAPLWHPVASCWSSGSY